MAVVGIDRHFVPASCQDPFSPSFPLNCSDVDFLHFALFAQILWPNSHSYHVFDDPGSYSDFRNDSLIGAIQSGWVATEMASYRMSPERVAQFDMPFPIKHMQASLYYNEFMDRRVEENHWVHVLRLFRPATLPLSLLALALHLLTSIALRFSPPKHATGIQLLQDLSFGAFLFAFGQNTTGSAMDILRTDPPFRSVDDIRQLINENRIRFHFMRQSDSAFRDVLSRSTPILRAIADSFEVNSPRFGFGTSFYEQLADPQPIFIGAIRESVLRNHPCVKKAAWFQDSMLPQWQSLIFRNSDSLCPEKEQEIPYDTLGIEFAKDLVYLQVLVLPSVLAFCVEYVIGMCRFRRTWSPHSS